MQVVESERRQKLDRVLNRLSEIASERHQNVYRAFIWPGAIPEDQLWMSPELLTVAGTAVMEELSETQLCALSRFESLHFYSLNVHGIRELLAEVVARIHTREFEPFSDFLHHFLGEENEHMWYFARFCMKYGGRIYPDRSLKLLEPQEPRVQDFLVFARITLFEELVDHFNSRMARDSRLHPFIREINRAHHADESRHLAFGREMLRWLHEGLKAHLPAEELSNLEQYLRRYMLNSIESLYDPQVYRDAGIGGNVHALRKRLLNDPARRAFHEELTRRVFRSFHQSGIFSREELYV